MTKVDPLIGRDLNGRYTIVDTIGRGNMGAVYGGTQNRLGREVAIKVVTPRIGRDPTIVKRFMREAQLASKLSHPNAVAVIDFGQTDDGLIYLVMELVKGSTLDEIIAAEGKLAASRVVRIGSQICNALEGAHAIKIVHRDLKPSNIMLTPGDEHVKVLDFGLAKSLESNSVAMTSAGAILGTPAFIPPESLSGNAVDGRADLYSLGCTLFFAAMGRLPFESSAITEMIALHLMEPPPPLVGVQVALARVIERLLAKDPAARYPDAAATRDALEATLAAGNAVVPPPVGTAPQKPKPKLSKEHATMLGWATPAAGVPITKPGAAESGPIARPGGDVVVKLRTGESAPITRPTGGDVAVKLRTGESAPISRPTPTPAHATPRPPTPAQATPVAPRPPTPAHATPVAPAPSHAPPTKTLLTQRRVSIAWILIVLVIVASGALVAYKLTLGAP